MLKNYLKTAWRSIWKNTTISLINIVGLRQEWGYFWNQPGKIENISKPEVSADERIG